MTPTFLRLKLRLLRNILRRREGLGLVVFAFVALTLGGSTAVWLWRDSIEVVTVAAPVLATAVVGGWALAPLLFGASDETIDPSRLALFPLEARPLAHGIAAAGLIGPGPIAASIPAITLALRAPNPVSMVIGFAAVATLLTSATIASRWLLTSLGSQLRKRRGRDLATLIAGLSAGAFGLGLQALTYVGDDISRRTLAPIARVVRWLPISWSGDALGRVAAGEVAVPLVEVLATAALTVFALDRWSVSLARSLTEVDEGSAENRLGRPLLGRVTRLDTASPRVAAVLAKEQRYLVRHPRYRVQIVSQGTVLLVGGAPFVTAVVNKNPEAVLLGCIPGLTAGVTGSNLLGSDGRGLWLEALALPTLRPLLRGRSMAFILLGIGLSIPLTLGVAVWTGGWQFVFPALGAAVGMSLAGAGVGAYSSTLAPTPFPDDANPNPFAGSSPGGGCLNGIATFSGVIVGLVAAAPILAGLGQAEESTVAGLIVAFGSPFYGAGIWLLATGMAGRRVDKKIPELLLTLSR